MSKEDLMQVRRMLNEAKTFEKRLGYDRLAEWSRLPKTIKIRRGFKVYTYSLEYADIDERVYLSYTDKTKAWSSGHRVLMHFDENTFRECIMKAWRKLALDHIKVAK